MPEHTFHHTVHACIRSLWHALIGVNLGWAVLYFSLEIGISNSNASYIFRFPMVSLRSAMTAMSTYCGWLRHPAPVGRLFTSLFLSAFHTVVPNTYQLAQDGLSKPYAISVPSCGRFDHGPRALPVTPQPRPAFVRTCRPASQWGQWFNAPEKRGAWIRWIRWSWFMLVSHDFLGFHEI